MFYNQVRLFHSFNRCFYRCQYYTIHSQSHYSYTHAAFYRTRKTWNSSQNALAFYEKWFKNVYNIDSRSHNIFRLLKLFWSPKILRINSKKFDYSKFQHLVTLFMTTCDGLADKKDKTISSRVNSTTTQLQEKMPRS